MDMLAVNLKQGLQQRPKHAMMKYKDEIFNFGLVSDIFLVNLYGRERFVKYLKVYAGNPQTYYPAIKTLSNFVIDDLIGAICDSRNSIDSIEKVMKL